MQLATSLEFEFCLQFPCDCPSTELSDFRQSAQSGNERECKENIEKHMKARAKGNDVITYVISANQHFASAFLMQIFKFQTRSWQALLPFPARPPECPGELAGKLNCVKIQLYMYYSIPSCLIQIILQDHKHAEVELMRHRMSRVSHNMPDTLYMIEPQKRTYTAPARILSASASGRRDRDEQPSTPQTCRNEENELERYVRNRHTSDMSSGRVSLEGSLLVTSHADFFYCTVGYLTGVIGVILEGFTVVSIQSRFDTSRFDTN